MARGECLLRLVARSWPNRAFRAVRRGVHGGLRGFTIIGGTPEQIGALRFDDEFVSYIMRSQLCNKDVGVTPLFFGETLSHIMERWEHEVSALA